MTNIFRPLLMVLLCLPYLAFAMPHCGHDMMAHQVCPHQDLHDQTVSDLNFIMACAGVDTQLVQLDVALQKSDQITTVVQGIQFKTPVVYKLAVRVRSTITLNSSTKIFLTTQRFRP